MADVYIPQDIDYPALQLDIDRTRASELGLDQKEVVGNVITALTSNQMIAPSYWVDPEDRQRLHADRPVSRAAGEEPDRPQLDSAARRRHHAARRAWMPSQHPHASSRPPKWTIIRSAALSTSIVRPLGEDLGRIANAIDGIIARD